MLYHIACITRRFFVKLYGKPAEGLGDFGEPVATGKEGNEVSFTTTVFERRIWDALFLTLGNFAWAESRTARY